jgi:hypothetical protein
VPDERLVQVAQRDAEVRRVPIGGKPTFEFNLQPHERIVGVHHYFTLGGAERKTEDHHLIVWVVAEL